MAISQETNLAALRLINPGANEVRFVQGHDNADDRGAGIFEWVPTHPVEPDDDATVIKPNGIGSSSTGRWIRQLDVRGPVHAEWFGALGDGTTNDWQAIKDCLTTFGRVTLLARTYVIESPIELKPGWVVEGQGIDLTVILNKTEAAAGASTSAFVHNPTVFAHNAVIRDLTIDCGYDSVEGKTSAHQAIALLGENILVERVKATHFSTGSASMPCAVISLEVANNKTKMGIIQDCIVTEPGDNHLATSPAEIRCLVLKGQTNPSGSYPGQGGRVARNRILSLPYSGGTSGTQRSPLKGICVTRAIGAEVVDNEVVGFDGPAVCLTSDTSDGDKDCVIRGNRLITVNTGVFLEARASTVQHEHTIVEDNLVLLGKVNSDSGNTNELRGIHASIPASTTGSLLINNLYVQRNYIQGTTVGTKVPTGICLDLNESVFGPVHVEENVIETPDAVSGDFNVPYENAVAFTPASKYDATKIAPHGNRNLAGTDLRLKIGATTTKAWGPFSTCLARFQAPAFDGRVGLATEEFLGDVANGFALSWIRYSTGFGQVVAQAGESGHPGIVQLDTGSSSSVSSSLLKYGVGGVVLSTATTQVIEFGARRMGDASSAEDFECRLGLMAATGNDGVYFKVFYGAPSNNRMLAVCANGATSSSSSSAQTEGHTWHTYRIEVLPSQPGSQYLAARFYVDGIYLWSIQNDATNTYIPGGALQAAFKVDRISGTVNKGLLVDYFQHQVTPT